MTAKLLIYQFFFVKSLKNIKPLITSKTQKTSKKTKMTEYTEYTEYKEENNDPGPTLKPGISYFSTNLVLTSFLTTTTLLMLTSQLYKF